MPGGNKGEGNVANGLYHFGQRYYDLTTGRWTQQDPEDRLGSATQGDRFLFAGADPINLSDPTGRLSLGKAWEYVEKSAETAYENPEAVVACHPLVYASGVCEEWANPERRNSGIGDTGASRASGIQLHALESSRIAKDRSKERVVDTHELMLVMATSVSHVLVIIAGIVILVLSKGLWMLGRKR